MRILPLLSFLALATTQLATAADQQGFLVVSLDKSPMDGDTGASAKYAIEINQALMDALSPAYTTAFRRALYCNADDGGIQINFSISTWVNSVRISTSSNGGTDHDLSVENFTAGSHITFPSWSAVNFDTRIGIRDHKALRQKSTTFFLGAEIRPFPPQFSLIAPIRMGGLPGTQGPMLVGGDSQENQRLHFSCGTSN